MYGLIGKVSSVPGQGDALIALLIGASANMPGCLSYVVAKDTGDESGIWVTELDGGTPRDLVRLSDRGDPITSFAWSPDGKLLALSRGRWTGDVALIKGLR
jgi:Antibiotic biosynthesis monooxygenase